MTAKKKTGARDWHDKVLARLKHLADPIPDAERIMSRVAVRVIALPTYQPPKHLYTLADDGMTVLPPSPERTGPSLIPLAHEVLDSKYDITTWFDAWNGRWETWFAGPTRTGPIAYAETWVRAVAQHRRQLRRIRRLIETQNLCNAPGGHA